MADSRVGKRVQDRRTGRMGTVVVPPVGPVYASIQFVEWDDASEPSQEVSRNLNFDVREPATGRHAANA